MFFLEYRDPLFSIILFFGIIFIITSSSYWWGRYRRSEDNKRLDRFLKQFRTLPSQKDLHLHIKKGELPDESWLLLAHSYSTSGDYEKSIKIYNEMLSFGDRTRKIEVMLLLGKTYFKAGFLERAKEIFLEILKNKPRTPRALHYLLLVYENIQDYKQALAVLEPLDELGEDTSLYMAYLKSIELLNDMEMKEDKKIKKLLEIYKDSHQLTHTLFKYLFSIKPKIAWENFDSSKSYLLSDLFWQLPVKDLDLDIISKNSYLKELYTARGDISLVEKSSIFEFDILINLHGKTNTTLKFEYLCQQCQFTQPFPFHRCSNCHSIDTQKVEFSLTRDYNKDFSEENNSFQ